MMIQSNTTNETEGTVEVFNFARDSGDEEVNIDMDDGPIEAAAAPSFFKFRSFCGGKILTIGGIVLAVAIAFATGFASGNAAKQAELVQMKAEASTSALSTSKSSKAKSSKALGWECEMMEDMHFIDSYHGISCGIDAVTACAGYSPPDACCYEVTMEWGETKNITLAAMLTSSFTGKSALLAVQGSNGNGTIAGAITLPASMKNLRASDIMYNFALTDATNQYVFAYGALDVVCNK